MTTKPVPVIPQRATKFVFVFFRCAAPGQNDDIRCRQRFLTTSETFSHNPFYAIARHSRSNLLFGNCHPEPGMCQAIGYIQHGEVFICTFTGFGKNLLEFSWFEQPQMTAESTITTAQGIRLTAVYAPWLDAHSVSFDHYGFSCGRENHGYVYALYCWAGMFSSWLFPFVF